MGFVDKAIFNKIQLLYEELKKTSIFQFKLRRKIKQEIKLLKNIIN